jgi:hypothetical protein
MEANPGSSKGSCAIENPTLVRSQAILMRLLSVIILIQYSIHITTKYLQA